MFCGLQWLNGYRVIDILSRRLVARRAPSQAFWPSNEDLDIRTATTPDLVLCPWLRFRTFSKRSVFNHCTLTVPQKPCSDHQPWFPGQCEVAASPDSSVIQSFFRESGLKTCMNIQNWNTRRQHRLGPKFPVFFFIHQNVHRNPLNMQIEVLFDGL